MATSASASHANEASRLPQKAARVQNINARSKPKGLTTGPISRKIRSASSRQTGNIVSNIPTTKNGRANTAGNGIADTATKSAPKTVYGNKATQHNGGPMAG